ncbi:MAG: flagellin biosynthesis protein FlgE [Desulfobacter postgatei]|uniref:Flagellar hook protein FlgE n=1 Tax=Desulfobacter postgatei TaxID=2293 RepID=A0A2G6MRS7_9BACT|nr:MAG: flagellin biosynthesis protein FlgE [Desulfobacter postgatei]
MSLTSSLYAGTSGLGNTGNALQVTSNNISNINTVGFKKGSATFADTLYQTIGTNAGASQVGLGMNVDNVAQVFTDGSLETTSNATDLAIGGDGFFIVSENGSEQTYYTRAGNFSFDENGALVNSAGFILQGWYVEGNSGEEYGAITDLILTEFTSPPDDTEEITVITNLDSDAQSKSVVLSNLFKHDVKDGTTVDSDGYEYQTVVTAYDSLGSAHEVTVYYDKKSDTNWEYIITCDPDEDHRALVAGTDAAGLLARGSISFSESSGEVVTMTMEELTGVVGNVEISGNNTVDDVHFEIEDPEAIQWDGYGIRMTYNGDNWELVDSGDYKLPDTYNKAKIIYSDSTSVYLVLDPASSGLDEEADLKISLDEYAMAGDTLTFDVNNPRELHVQDIENAVYLGDAYNNTTISINNPGVLTVDAEDISLIWNPYTETWSWSNPAGTAKDRLVSDDDGVVVYDVRNADAMNMVVEDISLYYDGGNWQWNNALKNDDITIDAANTYSDGVGVTVEKSGSSGAAILAGDYTLTWDDTAGAWAASTTNTSGAALTVTGEDDTYVLTIQPASGDASTMEISLDGTPEDGDTIKFTMKSTPPEEYADATITTTTPGNPEAFSINFDGDNAGVADLIVTNASTLTSLNFDVNPDTPPDKYSNATLSGDATYCSIDLDGSGNEDDRQDIVFTFEDELKSGKDTDPLKDRSVITFDISGSTAWRTVTTDEAKNTGYYQFTADFLGGEFGATENDISFNIGSKFDGNNWVNDSLSSTQYATSSSTTYQDADGYPAGDLTGIGVESSGLVSGTYSNGQELALFMIALADFNNVNGLESEGGNLYSATRDSGTAITNKPGENGLGSLSSYALEMSNVDISEEFVSMIELQNAYDANAKIITTVDEMMSTVIGMKR